MKLQRMTENKQYFICLPKNTMASIGWKKGDEIQVIKSDDKIILERI